MREGDVGVKVGPGETLAGLRIESPDDVAAALPTCSELAANHETAMLTH